MNSFKKTCIFVASLLTCLKVTAISLPFASTIKAIYKFIDNQTIDEQGNYLNVTITMQFLPGKGPVKSTHVIKRKLRANGKVDAIIDAIKQQLAKKPPKLNCHIHVVLFANIKPNVYIDQELSLWGVTNADAVDLHTKKLALDEIADLVKQALEALPPTSSTQ